MTVSTLNSSAEFVTNGATVNFPLGFKFLTDADLVVTYTDAAGVADTLALGTDYTVSGAGSDDGGTVTTLVALPAGRLVVERDILPYQDTSLRNQGAFYAETHESVFDKLMMLIQQLLGRSSKALRVRPSEPDPAYLPPINERANKLLSFDTNGNPVSVAAASGSATQLAIDLATIGDPLKGAGMLSFDTGLEYAPGTAGHALRELPVENQLWAGFFDSWPMGFSRAVLTAERVQIPAGVTHGRAGFVAGTTVYQSNPGEMRIQRNAGTTDTANHTVCINLSASETASLRGKTCTAHVFMRAGANYSGAGVTFRVQSSVEPEQPVLSSVAQYTNGYNLVASQTVLPGTSYPRVPLALTFNVPADATQIAIAFIIPFAGTAGTNDYVELYECAVYQSDAYRRVRRQARDELDAKAETRYQTSYPYGSSFGANTTQGAVTAVALSTATSWAMTADVRFSQRMVIPPRFQFVAPGSGIRSRWLNVDAGTFLNGLAYDLSDSGVTVTNNAAAIANNRYLFQWAADCLF